MEPDTDESLPPIQLLLKCPFGFHLCLQDQTQPIPGHHASLSKRLPHRT
jgi:hypothetical protein